MDYLVTYDISNPKVRLKVSRTLQRYGYRILYSAFYLVNVDDKTVDKLYKILDELIDKRRDRVFFYPVDPPEVFKGYPLEPWKVFIL